MPTASAMDIDVMGSSSISLAALATRLRRTTYTQQADATTKTAPMTIPAMAPLEIVSRAAGEMGGVEEGVGVALSMMPTAENPAVDGKPAASAMVTKIGENRTESAAGGVLTRAATLSLSDDTVDAAKTGF